jgi:opacity protein-like surface antigen
MKKLLICALVGVMGLSTAFGQSSTPASGSSSPGYANGADKNFHFGLNFKLGDYWLSASAPNAPNSSSIGYGFGLNLEFYFTQNYGFCTGLELTSFGANYTTTTAWTPKNAKTADSIVANSFRMQYLEIPLMLKFRTQPIGLMRYFGTVGLNPGIRTKSTNAYTVTGDGSTLGGNAYTANYSEPSASANSETSIIRLAYVIGAGVEYNIAGTTSLAATIAFDGDFLNLNSTSNTVTDKAITLTIGVLF